MTVKELMTALKKCSPDAEVRYPMPMGAYELIDFVVEDSTFDGPHKVVYISGEYAQEDIEYDRTHTANH